MKQIDRSEGRLARVLALLDRRCGALTAAVLALAAASYVAILAEAWRDNPFARSTSGDAAYYWDWAGRIAAGEAQLDHPFLAAPLYPYLLAPFRWLGAPLLAVYAAQALLLLVAGWLSASAAGRAIRGAAAPVTAALVVFSRDPAFLATRALHTTLQLFFVAWLAWELTRWRAPASRASLTRLALTLGLGALANPLWLALIPFGVLWVAWFERSVARGAAVLAVALLCVLPATWHNWRASGELIAIASHGGVTFAHGNAPAADGTYCAIPGVTALGAQQDFDLRRVAGLELGREPTWSEVDEHFRRRGFAFWREQPGRALALALRKARWFLSGRNYGESYVPELERSAGFAGRLALAPIEVAWFALPGLIGLLAWARRDRRAWVLALAALAIAGACVVFFYSPRYRAPAVPALAIGAAWLALRACEPGASAWRRGGVLAVFAVSFGSGFINARTEFDRLEPLQPLFESNLGQAYFGAGELARAEPHLRAAVDGRAPYARGPLAEILRERGERDAALALLRSDLVASEDVFARRTRAVLLAETGALAAARAELDALLRDHPQDAAAVALLGNVALAEGRPADALVLFDRSERARGESAELCFNRGQALDALGRAGDALAAWRRALELAPALSAARERLLDDAVARGDWRAALELAEARGVPTENEPWLVGRRALLLATIPDATLRDGARALQLCNELVAAGGGDRPEVLEALAAAQAESGALEIAVRSAERARELALTLAPDLVPSIERRLASYRAGRVLYAEPRAPQ